MSDLVLHQDFERAASLYSTQPPELVGRFVLSQDAATTIPVSLDEGYDAIFQAIAEDEQLAMKYAKTFGALNIRVALDDASTSFRMDSLSDRSPANSVEVQTVAERSLKELLTLSEVDSSTAFLLTCDDEPVTVEMALIKALHMIDTALVTDQYSASMPLVRAVTTEQLLKLRNDFPEVFIRMYGNTRGLDGAPKILGTVVPTELVVRSGISTTPLNTKKNTEILTKTNNTNMSNKPKKAFVGITTAKKPHVGHALLLAKAVADNNEGDGLIILLNDQGPRVEQALAALATRLGVTLEEIASQASLGVLGVEDIQAGYQNRGEATIPDTKLAFSLAGPNSYYRRLLKDILPNTIDAAVIADSDLGLSFQELVGQNDLVKELFSGLGMTLLQSSEGNGVMLQKKGGLTVAGILAALGDSYQITLVDSPPPLSRSDRAVFCDAGLEIEQGVGTGIMIDGDVASGTKGNIVGIEQLIDIVNLQQKPLEMLLPAIRLMMNEGYFLPSEGTSVSLNFSTNEALIESFMVALEKVAVLENPTELLFQPMQFKDILREAIKDLFMPTTNSIVEGKPTVSEVRTMLDRLPILAKYFSQKILSAVETGEQLDGQVIPKNMISDSDRKTIQTIRVGNPKEAIKILIRLGIEKPEKLDELVAGSVFGGIMTAMGYKPEETVDFLAKMQTTKGIYKLV